MSDIDKLRASAILGRIATLGGAYQLELRPFIQPLGHIGPELADRAWITVPAGFDRVAVSTWLPPAPETRERVQHLADLADAALPTRLLALAGDRIQQVRIEVESAPAPVDGLTIELTAVGRRNLDEDAERIRAAGDAPADVVGELVHAARLLGADDGLSGLAVGGGAAGDSVTLIVGHKNFSGESREHTRMRLRETAVLLGVTRPQRDLVESVHDMLAREQPSQAALRLRGGALARELSVMWADVPWEHVVRMMIGFHPGGDCARRLGELAGAAGAEAVAATAVELVLGTAEPPRMRVTAKLQPELS